MRSQILFYFALVFLLTACEDWSSSGDIDFSGKKGVYLLCEGNSLYGNSSLAYYDAENQKVYPDVYFDRNNLPLGDMALSMGMFGDHIYIVVNNSGKLVVIDKDNMEHKGTIQELISPRAVHFVSNKKAYISDMQARRITVFNPGTLAVTGYIPVSDGKPGGSGHATESFVQVGKLVFVTCWLSDNKVLVIDSETDAVIDSVSVPYQPRQMVVDALSKIWIQTDGEPLNSSGNPEKAALVRLDPLTRKVEKTFWMKQTGAWIADIRLNPSKDSLLFLAGDLYKMSVKSDKLPDKSLMTLTGKACYSFGVDPFSGELYLGDARDYSRNGVVYRFSPQGFPLDTLNVGVCPGDFLFKN
ncbi:MAG TPA: hypothetical protein PLW67_11395 [Prolixibacteraceae bacterium]|nr:hypothetical protein [Prolixibacteraceae bacterium]